MRRFMFFTTCVIVLFLVFSCDNTVRKANNSDDITPDDNAGNDENAVEDEDAAASDESMDDQHDDASDETVDDIVSDGETDDIADQDNEVPDNNGNACTESSQCGGGNYCHKDLGMCFAEGVCQGIPDGCTEMYFPVCGCDDSTYDNDCFANAGSTSVFYNLPCLKDMASAVIDFNYKKNITSEDMSGGVYLTYDGNTGEILVLSAPESENNGNLYYMTVNFSGANGLKVVVNFNFQRDPFVLPQQFELTSEGDDKATVLTDSGLVVGYLTGTLEVTAFTKDITGGFTEFVMHAEGLTFVSQ